MSAASTVAETFYYSRLLWRSRNTCLKLNAPYFGTDALSRFACSGLRWPFAGLSGPWRGLSLGGQAMGRYLRQLVVPFSVGAKCRKFWLIAATGLAPLSLGLSEPAVAQTCAPVPNGGSLSAANPTAPPARVPLTPTSTSVGSPHPRTSSRRSRFPGAQVLIPAGWPHAVNLDNARRGLPGTGTSAAITAINAAITLCNPGAPGPIRTAYTDHGNATITASGTPHLP